MASFNVTGACDVTICQCLLFFLMPANLTAAEDSSPLITWGPPGAWNDSPDGDSASQVSAIIMRGHLKTEYIPFHLPSIQLLVIAIIIPVIFCAVVA